MARQLGSAIGVAVLVALVDSAGADLLHGIRGGWWFALGAGLGAAVLAFSPPGAGRRPRPPTPRGRRRAADRAPSPLRGRPRLAQA